jgi:hypothetical protein
MTETKRQDEHSDSPACSSHLYTIADEFSAGFCAAIRPEPRRLTESDHWIAGWDAGYVVRKARTDALNAYLVSLGKRPLSVIRVV